MSAPPGAGAAPQRVAYAGCPLCASSATRVLRAADCSAHPLYVPALPAVMTWLACEDCSHVFTDGFFNAAAQALLFAHANAAQRVGADLERQRAISARIVARVRDFGPQDGAWLDVGFGNGSLLFTACEYGYEPVGTDLRAQNVEALRHVGYECHQLDLPDLDRLANRGRFSVISMADVLEHMAFPGAALEAAAELLGPGGTLLVSLPAYESPVWQYLDGARANPYWAEIEHYHNFSRARLKALLAQYGFHAFTYGVSERYRACMEVLARRSDP